jgi:hypothetical protein
LLNVGIRSSGFFATQAPFCGTVFRLAFGVKRESLSVS